MSEWYNWSGSLSFTPSGFIEPSNVDELTDIAGDIFRDDRKFRVVGAGHSSSPLVMTDGVLLSLRKLKSVENVDTKSGTAWTGTGLTVKEAGNAMLEHDLSMHNTGDVDVQSLCGAISTGTHGTGIALKNLSSMLTGCTMLCADGVIREFTEEQDGKEFFDALRVSLGSFGIMVKMRLKLLPAFDLQRKEWCTHTDECLTHLDELINDNRNFDFYWYPRNDLVKLRTLNEPGKVSGVINFARCVREEAGSAIDILPRERRLKFDEMEYALPLEAGPECFNEVRKIIKKKFRKTVAWRVLYRTVASDDSHISPFSGRTTATISLHQNAGVPFMEYFKEIEPVFLHYDGRPHWGKKHNLTSKELSRLYPRWNDFLRIRQKMDPGGIFLNDYLKKQIFGL